MATIRINGLDICAGHSLQIENGRVFVDGAEVTTEGKSIQIEVQGDVDSLVVDACERVHVTGNVKSVEVKAGDVSCQDVHGSVSTIAGDVRCGAVRGSISTMSGDVHHR